MITGIGRWLLGAFFALFVLFLYGPTLTIVVLSFQGPEGGLTFPMRGVSLAWFTRLFEPQAVGDLGTAFARSLALGAMVMAATTVIAVAAALAFRLRFHGSGALFTLTVASLIVPGVLVSLGVGLTFDLLGWDASWWNSAFGAQLTWTLPFGLLIMFAVFNRFDRAWEEAARDLGASPWRVFSDVVLPIIAPGVVGIALFGFSLSYDEFARTMLTAGSTNTLPLEIVGMTTNVTSPVLYSLGTITTSVSLVAVVTALLVVGALRSRSAFKTPKVGSVRSL
jgi:putative spermidine/putrescine transport system permease protein